MKPRNDPGRHRRRPEDELEEALERRPPDGEGLDPETAGLVRLASDLRQLAPPAGEVAARRRIWARLLPAIRQHRASRPPAGRSTFGGSRPAWRPALALTGLLAAVGLLGASAGVARASGDALPGDPLYPLKRGIERARIGLSWTSEGDAALWVGYAQERLMEAEQLVSRGRVGDLGEALNGYEEALDALVVLADDIPVEDGPGSLEDIQEEISRNLEALERVRERVPAAAADAIGEVIERAAERQAEVEQAAGRGHPERTPPGQIRRATAQPDGSPANSGEPPGQDHGGGHSDHDRTPPAPGNDKHP
jgi:hypothetical protein